MRREIKMMDQIDESRDYFDTDCVTEKLPLAELFEEFADLDERYTIERQRTG